MNIFESLNNLITSKINKVKQSNLNKRTNHNVSVSQSIINVMEFDGRIFIAHNGVPIIRQEDINGDIIKVLSKVRQDYLKWIDKE